MSGLPQPPHHAGSALRGLRIPRGASASSPPAAARRVASHALLALHLALPPVVGAQLSSSSWWPKFQRDLQNTGYVSAWGLAGDPHVRWAVRLSAPLTGENHATPVFSPDNARLYVGGPASTLSAIRASDGVRAWTRQLGDGTGHIFHTAAVAADGSIYVGSWDNVAPYDGFCKVRDNGATATVVWTFPLRRVLASPTITADGLIIVGGLHTTDGWAYYALRDLGPNYVVAWSAGRRANPSDPNSTGNVGSSPAISPDGAWVYGGSDQNRCFWKIATSTGAEHARLLLREYLWAPAPAVADTGHVFVGEGLSYASPNDDTQGKLFAIRPDAAGATGVLESLALRSGHLNGGIAALRRAEDGQLRLYVAANGQGKPNAQLIAVRFDPDAPSQAPPQPAFVREWASNVGPSAFSYPAAVVTRDAVIYVVGPADHTLYALRDAGGSARTLWSLPLASVSRVTAWQPVNQRGPQGAVVGPNGRIYWNAPDGYLYALNGWRSGDLDGNELVNADDLAWLQRAVDDRAAYELSFPEIDLSRYGDLNGDAVVDAADVTRLEALLALP
ncbi:MAG: hypothetical protein AB7Q17_01540 [Phycisphaerae bacterium]